MSTTISTAFIEEFAAEVKLDYQRMGSHLRGAVRNKEVPAEQCHFTKMAKGTANTKSRHGDVTPMDLVHSRVSCTMADYYAPEYVDDLDELKTNIDERSAITQSEAAALGRKTDEIIVTALESTSNATTSTGGVTLAKCEEIFEAFGNNDVPDDGQRYIAVSPQGWTDLLGIDQFSNADYMGSDDLPYKGGMSAKRFMGFTVFGFSGLTKVSTTRTSLAWHKSAVGLGINKDIDLDTTWQGTKQAYLFVSKMSMGSVAIDDDGIYELQHTES